MAHTSRNGAYILSTASCQRKQCNHRAQWREADCEVYKHSSLLDIRKLVIRVACHSERWYVVLVCREVTCLVASRWEAWSICLCLSAIPSTPPPRAAILLYETGGRYLWRNRWPNRWRNCLPSGLPRPPPAPGSWRAILAAWNRLIC